MSTTSSAPAALTIQKARFRARRANRLPARGATRRHRTRPHGELRGDVADVVFETVLRAPLEHHHEIRLGRRLDRRGMPRVRSCIRSNPFIVQRSMYSKIIGCTPEATTRGMTAATASMVAKGARIEALCATAGADARWLR